MALAAKIAVFSLLLNIAAGILGVALEPNFHTQSIPIGIGYSAELNAQSAGWNGTATVPGVDPSSGWWIKFLDFITLGFVQKFQTFLDNTLYGIVGMFQTMGLLDPAYYLYFYSIISIIYMIGIIEIFTNKFVVR
jgi:hypothetical protein